MGDRSVMGQGMTVGGMMGSMARHIFRMRNGVPPVLSRPDQFAAGYAKPNSRGRCALRPNGKTHFERSVTFAEQSEGKSSRFCYPG